MTEQDIKDMAEAEINRFKLEAKNKLLESEGLAREAVQCAKNTESMFERLRDDFDLLSRKFSAIRKWLLGTNGNTVSEEDIHESFISQFTQMKKDMSDVLKYIKNQQPWYKKVWLWAQKKPKVAGVAALLILNALGFSAARILNFLHKLSTLFTDVESVIPK